MKFVPLKILLVFAISILAACNDQSSGESDSDDLETDFPQDDIEIIVPYAPGGSNDISVRLIASVAEKYVPNDQSIAVVNTPGIVGTSDIATAPNDGYTIGAATTGTIGVQPFVNDTSFDLDSFEPIAGTIHGQAAFLVSSEAPFDDFDEWLEYTEENPGEFSFAASAAGNTTHLAAEAFNDQLNLENEVVPFEGAGPAISALQGGHVGGFVNPIEEVMSDVESGNLEVLADASADGIDYLEEEVISTQEEYGFNTDLIYGLVAPEGIPEPELNVLVDIFEQAFEDPELIEQLEEQDYTPSYLSPDEFAEAVAEDAEFFEEVYQAMD
ncbi:tripartite tricarboxylate transporter substrate binding protein [Salicibibacter cibi]|uniref:Tripartite tricarboxylate transporter substrate binding protein n=1 Tax=Salicibibacter cibi TaxID=2743001 RepID=A0A7T7CFL5_9BACI|nr:tripartite tricarboxylate transporter substrate binding protein [Salicibibacter cibi]QQK80285.1 tripartite tricarboxylate transporter substrate binding protein [Salicibibacter cibi]